MRRSETAAAFGLLFFCADERILQMIWPRTLQCQVKEAPLMRLLQKPSNRNEDESNRMLKMNPESRPPLSSWKGFSQYLQGSESAVKDDETDDSEWGSDLASIRLLQETWKDVLISS
ncbi:hypothetical protein R3I93_002641 [Phoxinus phoxinus]|uniref:Uncharacterized protein n=1 Tax=Phoxinus phoxinus TaxID=58324 RepID=A0AAN9DL53_9TELE